MQWTEKRNGRVASWGERLTRISAEVTDAKRAVVVVVVVVVVCLDQGFSHPLHAGKTMPTEPPKNTQL